MAIDYTGLAFPKPVSRYESKKARKTAEEAERRRVYAAVDKRDGRICRICRKHADPHALGLLDRAEHHHIIHRSKGGDDTTDNLILICRGCHQDIHGGKAKLEGDADADRGVALLEPTEAGWRVRRWL
jgi:5-methylcytosine-specific restriction endonuclease McrA